MRIEIINTSNNRYPILLDDSNRIIIEVLKFTLSTIEFNSTSTMYKDILLLKKLYEHYRERSIDYNKI